MRFLISVLLLVVFCFPAMSQQGMKSKKAIPDEQNNQNQEIEELLDFLRGKLLAYSSVELKHETTVRPTKSSKIEHTGSTLNKVVDVRRIGSNLEIEESQENWRSYSSEFLSAPEKSKFSHSTSLYRKIWKFDLRHFSPREFYIEEKKDSTEFSEDSTTKTTWNSTDDCYFLILKTRNNKPLVTYVSELIKEERSDSQTTQSRKKETPMDNVSLGFKDRQVAERCKVAFAKFAYLYGARDEAY